MYSAHHIVQASNISFIDFIVKWKGACSKWHLVRQMGRDSEFITRITLTLYDKKQEEGRSLLVLMFRKVFLVLLLEAEGLCTWSDCRVPHMSSASMKMHHSNFSHRPSLPLLAECSFPYISMENSILALHKPHTNSPPVMRSTCADLLKGYVQERQDVKWI